MSTLEKAIAIAAKAHEGQVDKAGAPYLLHPIRVMLKCSSIEERITAILHDVVEDGGVTIADLRQEGFSETILEAVDSVTIRPSESYEDFVLRAATNPIGKTVKLADLEDNCDLSRISNPTDRDYARINKYRRAVEFLYGHRRE